MNHWSRALLAGAALALGGCGGGGVDRAENDGRPPLPVVRPPALTTSDPEYHLQSERFTRHQPKVLEQIGAHHAYAKGLTGRGVRIGVEDSLIDYTQTGEFGSRVKLREADGADLTYEWEHTAGGPIDLCIRTELCHVISVDSEGVAEGINAAVRDYVARYDWPTEDEYVLLHDLHDDRYYEVPPLYDTGRKEAHGTQVASTAAGRTLGVAPEASLIPVGIDLSGLEGSEYITTKTFIPVYLPSIIEALSVEELADTDTEIAAATRAVHDKFDVINQSYGAPAEDLAWSDALDNQTRQLLATHFPKTWSAVVQADRPPGERTIYVRSAGNDSRAVAEGEGRWPFWIPEIRGHTLAVAATDPNSRHIAGYSSHCGPLPADWDVQAHGPHFCLAAPGTVRALAPDPSSPGRGRVQDGVGGTSFAAPVVSGALALIMEQFRGTKGNTAVARRMLDTANRRGPYGNAYIYGAGHLDLEAALSPVGALTTGQHRRPLARTALQTPTAFGAVGRRASDAELASFDAQAFPFWTPLSRLVWTRRTGRSPIPELDAPERSVSPAAGLEALGAHWLALNESAGTPSRADQNTRWIAGFAPGAATIARRDAGGWEHGFSVEEGRYLGAKPSGGFGSNLHTGMVWTSRSIERDLGAGVTLGASATLAASLPRYETNAIFEASPSLLSAASVRVGTEHTGLTLEQPLRAESGTGTFRLETGWIENGRRLYTEHRVALAPEARELRARLRHDREALGGTLALELSGAVNTGHVSGETDAGAGIAWRLVW